MATQLPTHLLGPGSVIQQVYSETAGIAITIATMIPFDDTIPQNTEGVEVLTATISPKFASSLLIVQFHCMVGGSSVLGISAAAALFRDSGVNALASAWNQLTVSAGYKAPVPLLYRTIAVSTAPTTFKVRMGGLSGTGSIFVSGSVGSNYLGGTEKATLVVTEVAA